MLQSLPPKRHGSRCLLLSLLLLLLLPVSWPAAALSAPGQCKEARVISGGESDWDESEFYLDGHRLGSSGLGDSIGVNLVQIDPKTQEVISLRSYDIVDAPDPSNERLVADLAAMPAGTVVLLSIRGGGLDKLSASAANALGMVGADIVDGPSDAGFALIGSKDAEASAQRLGHWVSISAAIPCVAPADLEALPVSEEVPSLTTSTSTSSSTSVSTSTSSSTSTSTSTSTLATTTTTTSPPRARAGQASNFAATSPDAAVTARASTSALPRALPLTTPLPTFAPTWMPTADPTAVPTSGPSAAPLPPAGSDSTPARPRQQLSAADVRPARRVAKKHFLDFSDEDKVRREAKWYLIMASVGFLLCVAIPILILCLKSTRAYYQRLSGSSGACSCLESLCSWICDALTGPPQPAHPEAEDSDGEGASASETFGFATMLRHVRGESEVKRGRRIVVVLECCEVSTRWRREFKDGQLRWVELECREAAEPEGIVTAHFGDLQLLRACLEGICDSQPYLVGALHVYIIDAQGLLVELRPEFQPPRNAGQFSALCEEALQVYLQSRQVTSSLTREASHDHSGKHVLPLRVIPPPLDSYFAAKHKRYRLTAGGTLRSLKDVIGVQGKAQFRSSVRSCASALSSPVAERQNSRARPADGDVREILLEADSTAALPHCGAAASSVLQPCGASSEAAAFKAHKNWWQLCENEDHVFTLALSRREATMRSSSAAAAAATAVSPAKDEKLDKAGRGDAAAEDAAAAEELITVSRKRGGRHTVFTRDEAGDHIAVSPWALRSDDVCRVLCHEIAELWGIDGAAVEAHKNYRAAQQIAQAQRRRSSASG